MNVSNFQKLITASSWFNIDDVDNAINFQIEKIKINVNHFWECVRTTDDNAGDASINAICSREFSLQLHDSIYKGIFLYFDEILYYWNKFDCINLYKLNRSIF